MVSPATTGRWERFKVIAMVTLFRFLIAITTPIRQWVGNLDRIEPPHEVIYIPSSKNKRTIRLAVYRNKPALSSLAPTAVHLNWHGSGWILPLIGQNGPLIRTLLKSLTLSSYPLTILDCSYALSPEHPCPADTEDARDAIDYVLAHPERYDISKITCSGFSAGATVALGISVAMGGEAREKAGRTFAHPIQAIVAFYPLVTWNGDKILPPAPPPGKKDWPGIVFPDAANDLMMKAHFLPAPSSSLTTQQYVDRVEELRKLPIVSPAEAPSSDFPPIVALWPCEYDTFAPKSEILRSRLLKDGVEVYGRTIKNVGHAWDVDAVREGMAGYEQRQEAYEACASIIAKVGGLDVDLTPIRSS